MLSMNYKLLLKRKLYESIDKLDLNEVCIAFSGGVDSTLLTRLCMANKLAIRLLTIGFLDSYDIKRAMQQADRYNLSITTKKIGLESLEERIKRVIGKVEWRRLVRLELCVFYYNLFKVAYENQYRTVMSADGVDALFCGYDVYRRSYDEDQDLNYLMKILAQQAIDDKKEINKVAEIFDIRYITPFLSEDIITLAEEIPLKHKIRGNNDRIRKHIIREIALENGIDRSIAYRSKSSLQYSSELHKGIEKLAQKAKQEDTCIERGTKSRIESYINELRETFGD